MRGFVASDVARYGRPDPMYDPRLALEREHSVDGKRGLKALLMPTAANRARQALKLAAQSLCYSDSALGAFYRHLSARMDRPRAIPPRRAGKRRTAILGFALAPSPQSQLGAA
jgi:hypothetical protein